VQREPSTRYWDFTEAAWVAAPAQQDEPPAPSGQIDSEPAYPVEVAEVG
jgi:hypothetical protein